MKISQIALFCLLPVLVFGAADSYRLSWRSDPSTSMVIAWNQVSGSDPEVCYDTAGHQKKADDYQYRQAPGRVVEYREMNNHFVRLENLEPNTAYYFTIRDSEGAGRRLWFRTAPAEPKPFTFIAGGDSRTNPKPRREGNKLVAKLRPLFVLFGGDYTGSGKPQEWAEWFKDWQLTISEDGRIYPIIATHGNHENNDMQMMDKLFDTPHVDQYYSFGVGGSLMRIWLLNSELQYMTPDRVPGQQRWIQRDLSRHPDVNWKLASYHRPMRPHTAYKQEGDAQVEEWAPLFYENGVDLVVESDTHMVKRSYPVRPFGGKGSHEGFIRDDKNGTVYIGEGSWGAPMRPTNDDKPWTMASASFYQFKWIQVHPDELFIRTVQFDNAGEVVPLTEDNLFDEPENMTFWTPETGKILRLPFDVNHPSYQAPAVPEFVFGFGSDWSWSLDGTTWVEGTAPFGCGKRGLNTRVASKIEVPRIIQFRKEFYIEDASRVSRLFFDVRADDGCEIKLNGKTAGRHNLPAGKITPETMAVRDVSGWAEDTPVQVPIDVRRLETGTNVVEVSVRQCDKKSRDLVFDMAVKVKLKN